MYYPAENDLFTFIALNCPLNPNLVVLNLKGLAAAEHTLTELKPAEEQLSQKTCMKWLYSAIKSAWRS